MIQQKQIEAVVEWLQDKPLEESLLGGLRDAFAGIHFSFCQDEDVIAATPVHSGDSFNLYLIDSRDHCLTVTQEMSVAGGILVAERDIEDDG